MSYLRDIAEAIKTQVPEALVPPESEDLFLLYAILTEVKGDAVGPEDVHNAWVAWMETRGESHESMVPFSELPKKVRAEDDPFVAAIRSVAQSLGRPKGEK